MIRRAAPLASLCTAVLFSISLMGQTRYHSQRDRGPHSR